eukprot:TRINITY_DN6089_c0_g1_i1.p1 TRINITY_DN6089_c0_g1~~TRINITY_DN6089_c0_g1_i1.p1  ORF type:complete len:315 (-),score=80.38 TRINITY_DN6089_c0_g1_i1:90-1034(-)
MTKNDIEEEINKLIGEQISSGEEETEEKNPMNQDLDDDEYPKDETLDQWVNLLKDMILEATNFAATENGLARQVIMNIAELGCSSLGKSKRLENKFLPLMNDIWPSLYKRLGDSSPPVTVAAAKTINELLTLCPSFLAKRFGDDLWPLIKKQFKKEKERKALVNARKRIDEDRLPSALRPEAVVAYLGLANTASQFPRVINRVSWDVAHVALECIGENVTKPVQCAATTLLKNLIDHSSSTMYGFMLSNCPQQMKSLQDEEATKLGRSSKIIEEVSAKQYALLPVKQAFSSSIIAKPSVKIINNVISHLLNKNF